MSKREIILVVFMVVAVLGGGYLVFFSSPNEKSEESVEADPLAMLQSHVDAMRQVMQAESLSPAQKQILSRAASEWKQDAFAARALRKEDAGQSSVRDVTISGYVEMDGRELVIINGMEYEEGAVLESGNYVVEKIDPDKVLLRSRSGETKVTIPIERESE